jgi:hypothetical protein
MARRSALLVVLLACAAATATSSAAAVPGFTGCRSFVSRSAVPVVRPRSIVIACADGNFYATGLAWTRWDAGGAAGAGTGHENDCTPFCAAGHFHTYRLAVQLSGVRTCGSRKSPQFTRLSWRWVGRKPAGPRVGSQTFRCA